MYDHSIKVPRLYKTAAKIAQQVKENGSSLKQLVYEKKHPNVKGIYALVVETLRNEENLKSVIQNSEILVKENRLDPWLARVLITELLWGKKKLPGESKPVKTVLSYHDEFLKENSSDKKIKRKSKKVIKPKYVRINTLKMTVEDAVENFRNEGWSLLRCGDGSDYSAFLATSACLGEEQFMIDTLVKDLLIFPSDSQFYGHKLYKNSCFVLQDKASCLAPYILNPPKGATVLDMCSAPGMKCIQLAAKVEKTGKIYAVEQDQRRYETLKTLVDNAGASNVITFNKDALTLTESDVPDVEYILVDPSCSGSGMIERLEFETGAGHCNELRLQKLAGFQITLLRHALNNYKSAKRVLYSTCSIFPQENEEVVLKALTTTPNFKLVPLNELLKDKWYSFGSDEYKIGPKCLYAKPDIDRTNGFFIALFERLEDGEVNEYFVRRVQKTSESENINGSSYDIKSRKRKKKENSDNGYAKENHDYQETSFIADNSETVEAKSKKQKKKKLEQNELYTAADESLKKVERLKDKLKNKDENCVINESNKKIKRRKISDNYNEVNSNNGEVDVKENDICTNKKNKHKRNVDNLYETICNENDNCRNEENNEGTKSDCNLKKKKKKQEDNKENTDDDVSDSRKNNEELESNGNLKKKKKKPKNIQNASISDENISLKTVENLNDRTTENDNQFCDKKEKNEELETNCNLKKKKKKRKDIENINITDENISLEMPDNLNDRTTENGDPFCDRKENDEDNLKKKRKKRKDIQNTTTTEENISIETSENLNDRNTANNNQFDIEKNKELKDINCLDVASSGSKKKKKCKHRETDLNNIENIDKKLENSNAVKNENVVLETTDDSCKKKRKKMQKGNVESGDLAFCENVEIEESVRISCNKNSAEVQNEPTKKRKKKHERVTSLNEENIDAHDDKNNDDIDLVKDISKQKKKKQKLKEDESENTHSDKKKRRKSEVY